MANSDKQGSAVVILLLIWGLAAIVDRLWFSLDQTIPAWDQADYLTGAMNYWHALQTPQWLSGEWWRQFWLLTGKIPPLTYLTTAFFLQFFGLGADSSALINLFCSAILLGAVYGLGQQLVSRQVGLWAAAICLVLPGLYRVRLDFLTDYPLTAWVTLSFYGLTVWWQGEICNQPSACRDPRISGSPDDGLPGKTAKGGWFWSAAFGVGFGLALLTKPTAVLFLVVPLLWCGGRAIQLRRWKALLQAFWGLGWTMALCYPWYRTNWLTVLTAGKRATVDSALLEGDPGLGELSAWLYYWKILPYQLSWPLLLVPIGVSLLILIPRPADHAPASPSFRPRLPALSPALFWLILFVLGGYFLCSLNVNKDDRYILPYLPAVALLMAWGLTLGSPRWGGFVRWGMIVLAGLLMTMNLFPVWGRVGEGMTHWLSPRAGHLANLETGWPHREVIATITTETPELQATVGVLPSTAEINQHNLNYFGTLANFQVYGRQVGTNRDWVKQDVRALDWFVTKTGDQGSLRSESQREAQAQTTASVEHSDEFRLVRSWSLPDASLLNLYHRQRPTVTVKPERLSTRSPVTLTRVIVPAQVPPGKPIPVTYRWTGSWDQLSHGLVLLTWRNQSPSLEGTTEDGSPKADAWWHDHGIALGQLQPPQDALAQTHRPLKVIERLAMLPPKKLKAGIYTLEAVYLNRVTGEFYPIAVPPTQLTIAPEAFPVSAPLVDAVSQLRKLSKALPKGMKALEPMMAAIGQLNLYDPIQDYVNQAEQLLVARLQQDPQNLDAAYGLALARVLQRRVDGAIEALERVIQLDPENPWGYGYLAFVNLYDFRARAAQRAADQAIALNSYQAEFHLLRGVAVLLQGNVLGAWRSARLYTMLET